MSKSAITEIEKEDWREAPGVTPEGTNSAFASRDYSVPCKHRLIVIIKGYWIWWCSTHHQPEFKCSADKVAEILREGEG